MLSRVNFLDIQNESIQDNTPVSSSGCGYIGHCAYTRRLVIAAVQDDQEIAEAGLE